jgi:hypothetical protein
MKYTKIRALVVSAFAAGCGNGSSSSLDTADAGVRTDASIDAAPEAADDAAHDAAPEASPAPPLTCQGLAPYPVAGKPGAPCVAPPGSTPAAGCDDSDGVCAGAGCAIDESKCGSSSTCLPMAANAGRATHDYRVRDLHVVAPEALAQAFVQQVIFTNSIDLDAPQCGENGTGGLNLLMRLDPAAGTVTVGSAPVSNDPFKKGYCFLTTPFGGAATRPQTACIEKGWSGKLPAVVLGFSLNGDPGNAMPIPLHELSLSGVTATDDCIGSLNTRALDKSCGADPATCAKWRTGGSMAGYVLLEEADLIEIADLNESLCVLLTRSTKGPDGKCQRDAGGKIAFAGDYCSITKTAGACADSFWFAGTFAASAVTIHDGAGEPACQ